MIIIMVDYLIINLFLFFVLAHDITYYLTFSFLWLVFSYIFDLNTLVNIRNINHNLTKTLLASLITGCLFIIIVNASFVDQNIYLVTTSMIGSLIIWRVVCYEILNSFPFTDRIALIGLTDFSKSFVNSLGAVNKQDQLYGQTSGRKIICIFDPDNELKIFNQIKIVAKIHIIDKYVRRLKIKTLIISSNKYNRLDSTLYRQLSGLQRQGVNIISLPDMYEKIYRRIPLQYVNDTYFVSLNMLNHARHHEIIKILLNCCFGIMGCFCLILIIPIVWGLNFLGNRGALFYSQERVGQDNKPFKILKFRTMIADAEKDGAKWAEKNDPRITKVGHILRQLRIDEIPQFINILKGNMSLIGPRPERPIFVENFTRQIPFYALRHQVKPGISGWAQVMYRYTASTEDTKTKLEYDLFYIKNYSLILDLKIIFKTIRVILRMQGQ